MRNLNLWGSTRSRLPSCAVVLWHIDLLVFGVVWVARWFYWYDGVGVTMMLFVWWCQWRHLTWLWLRSQDVKCRGRRRGNQKLDFIIHYTTNRISKGVQKDENSITLYKYITELCFLFVFAPLHKHWKHVSIIQQLYKRNHVSMKTIFRKEKKSVNPLIWTGNNDNETNNNSFMYY